MVELVHSGDVTPSGRVDALIAAAVGQIRDHAIIVLDPDGIIESWNAGAERVKGYRPEEVIGQHFSIFYLEADRRDGLPSRLLGEARKNGHVEHTGLRVRKDGSSFWADVVITAVRDDAGGLTGFVKVTRDRTDQKALEEERHAFLAVLAHDMKTPAAVLKGFTQVLEKVDENQRAEILERIGATADRICHLVDGLLDYSRLQAGQVSVLLEPVSLSDFVRSSARSLGPILDDRDLLVDESDVVAQADRAALHRVLDNLLSNAAKYSGPGTQIGVEISAQDGRARVAITDHGRGIDPGDLPTIFDEFARGRLARSDGGIGLGLASVRSLIELQDGDVWIDSELGVGTTVTFELPLSDQEMIRIEG